MFTHFWIALFVCFESVLAIFLPVVPTTVEIPRLSEPYSTTSGVVTRVIDGDTVDVLVGTSTNPTRVRYIGINTAELYPTDSKEPECGSKEATVANEKLVKQQTVTLITDADAFDIYGRLLAYVYLGDMFINKELITRGYATTLFIKPNIQYQAEFTQLRDVAKATKVGNWNICPDWN